MGKILVEERQLVIPGEELAEGIDNLPGEGAFREDDKIYSLKVGLAHLDNRLMKVIPLGGKYLPKEGDVVIGKVVDITMHGWRVDFGWPFFATIMLREGSREFIPNGADLTQYYDFGDYLAFKIIKVNGSKILDGSMKVPGAKKLTNGRLIEVQPTRVPRIIGKQGSMIKMLKEGSGCDILVGQNGLVWIKNENPEKQMLMVNAIKKIESESHKSGLTEKIQTLLKGGKK